MVTEKKSAKQSKLHHHQLIDGGKDATEKFSKKKAMKKCEWAREILESEQKRAHNSNNFLANNIL